MARQQPGLKSNIGFVQSTGQCFYFIESAPAETGDIIVAYNGSVVVGHREWNGQHTDIPVMGYSSTIEGTGGYMNIGDIPSFKLLKSSGKLINLNGS